MFARSLTVTLLLLSIDPIKGELVMTTSPNALIAGFTSNLVLRCYLTPTNMDSNIRVLALQIEKVLGESMHGLASISSGDSTAALDHPATGLTTEGSIPLTNAINSYIQLTIDNPSHQDAGDYVCVMSAMASSLLITLRANISVVDMEQNNDPHNTVLIHEMRKLKEDLTNITQRVKDCACPGGSRPSQSVSFTARPAQTRPFKTGQRMVFDAVDVNVGGHYDNTQGTFTAPVNGSYVIMATISVQEAKTLTDLIVNNRRKGQLVTSDNDQTSIAMVLDLQGGDIVWLQGNYDSHNTTDTNIFADRDTVFSGFLLHPDLP